MIVTIQNECLTVDIEDLGAQLASVRNHHGTEYLWQGDADIWARRAPILFPVLWSERQHLPAGWRSLSHEQARLCPGLRI